MVDLRVCDIPAAGFGGSSVTGLAVTHGVLGTVFLGFTLLSLIVVTLWLMRRWSQPRTDVVASPGPTVRRHEPEPIADPEDVGMLVRRELVVH